MAFLAKINLAKHVLCHASAYYAYVNMIASTSSSFTTVSLSCSLQHMGGSFLRLRKGLMIHLLSVNALTVGSTKSTKGTSSMYKRSATARLLIGKLTIMYIHANTHKPALAPHNCKKKKKIGKAKIWQYVMISYPSKITRYMVEAILQLRSTSLQIPQPMPQSLQPQHWLLVLSPQHLTD